MSSVSRLVFFFLSNKASVSKEPGQLRLKKDQSKWHRNTSAIITKQGQRKRRNTCVNGWNNRPITALAAHQEPITFEYLARNLTNDRKRIYKSALRRRDNIEERSLTLSFLNCFALHQNASEGLHLQRIIHIHIVRLSLLIALMTVDTEWHHLYI